MTERHAGPVLGVLAVADPAPQAAIGDWRPFPGGPSLGEIVQRCNERCSATYQSRRWAPEDAEALTELYDLLPFDLSHVDDLRSAQLATLRFILLDPASLARAGAGADEVLRRLTQLIDKLPPTRLLYVTQVAGAGPPASRAGAFATVRVVADRPEFVTSDGELAGFLLRSCELLQALEAGLSSPMRGEAPVFRSRRGPRPYTPGQPLRVAHQLLDAALDAQLDVSQASRFARAVGGVGDGSAILADVAVPDTLREAARAIRSGTSIEQVRTLIERGTHAGGVEAEVSIREGEIRMRPPELEGLFRPDVTGPKGDLPGGRKGFRGGRGGPAGGSGRGGGPQGGGMR